jgi:hypothetical protein
MKCLYLLLLAIVGVITPGIAQVEQWQKFSVADSITVDFPGKPKEVIQNDQRGYGLYTDGVLYSVAVLRSVADAGTTIEEKRQLYDEAMKGAAEKVKAKQIGNKRRFVINGFEGLEATFISGLSKLKNPVTMRTILINDTFYGQTFSASLDSAHVAARQHFFASFVPRVHPAPPTPAETRTTAYRLGELTGKLAVYVAVIAGIIFLLKRWSSPKKSKFSS